MTNEIINPEDIFFHGFRKEKNEGLIEKCLDLGRTLFNENLDKNEILTLGAQLLNNNTPIKQDGDVLVFFSTGGFCSACDHHDYEGKTRLHLKNITSQLKNSLNRINVPQASLFIDQDENCGRDFEFGPRLFHSHNGNVFECVKSISDVLRSGKYGLVIDTTAIPEYKHFDSRDDLMHGFDPTHHWEAISRNNSRSISKNWLEDNPPVYLQEVPRIISVNSPDFQTFTEKDMKKIVKGYLTKT